ncbi:hypothetical protein DAETH_41270 (plasmid) [Deinococcus aetherius]|uniref:Outer membrane protein assembly factor BamA n=1 Tax=Deinococcus aetherius TaxID=200252 RepID=A0ABM8AKA5_9DEIO|nr:hypothetical protein [Deinococcus aetherius]BDP44158.1 hypothetical protein DAETH_41270 [Deinococcus aetherius]
MRFLPLAALLLLAPVAAQTTGERLLSGTTFELPWGIYQGGLTNLYDGETRLRLSAPQGVRVLGTRYNPETHGALVAYRGTLSPREALAFAVNQLQRQGFELTIRAYPDPGQARALLRRNELLMEVRITRGDQGVTRALYLFRNGELPERLLVDQAPDFLRVYAAPVDLQTVQVERGRVILTPPGDVLIDVTSYRDGVASLQFYGNFSLEQLKDFYLPFFKAQGFVEIGTVREDDREVSFQFGRGDERLTVELEAETTDAARVDLRYGR